MIIPNYTKADSLMVYPQDIIGKWSCSYHEERDGVKVARYLHPDGWKRYGYWWGSFEEMERAFNRMGQTPLPITDKELNDEIEDRLYWDDYHEEQMEEMMDHYNQISCFEPIAA